VLHGTRAIKEDGVLEMRQRTDGWAGPAEVAHATPAPRVLIAVDESPGARRLLESGLAQAAAQNADVTVLHVAAPQRWRVGRFGPVRGIRTLLADPLESAVLRDARRLAFAHGICPRLVLVAAEDADTVIVELAAEIGAATIVVGAARADGPATLGVCHRVLRRAAVPVFVVPM
jgi:nucleotide-binding universal stress UspA family protein